MSTFLPLFALAALIVAGVFWSLSQSATAKLKAALAELDELKNKHQELVGAKEEKSNKERSRKSELEELREKVRDLKAKATEAQEQAQRAKDAEKARRESETETQAALTQARSELAAALTEAKAAREELSFGKRGRPAPMPAPTPVAKVEAAPPPDAARTESAAIATLETRLAAQHKRLEDAEGRAASEGKKAVDALKELERHKARLATSEKVYLVSKSDTELWKDRFRALEARYNKLMHELSALRRGVVSLEKRLPQVAVEEARAEVKAEEEKAWKAEEARQAAEAAAKEAADKAAEEAAHAQLAAAEAVAPLPPEVSAEAKPN
jgi:hypothetical protein